MSSSMQNWEAMPTSGSYEQHSSWFNLFPSAIKTEPELLSPKRRQHPIQFPLLTLDQMLNDRRQMQQQQSQTPQQPQHQHSPPPQLPGVSNSSSTALTPSPRNTDNMHNFFESNMSQQQHQQQQQQQLLHQEYQQQFKQAQLVASQSQRTSAHLFGFNPLTPPGLPNVVLPSMSQFYQQSHPAGMHSAPQTPSPQPHNPHQTQLSVSGSKSQLALTPRSTPPMDITPPKSPKIGSADHVNTSSITSNSNNTLPTNAEKENDLMSTTSEDTSKYIDDDSDDDENIRRPVYNSHGKMKSYKCRACSVVAITKVEYWQHLRVHIKPERMLQCRKCPFVTELKHHLEYHTKKHNKEKPFQCDLCSYTCVNQSMLNSHRKSHSTVYQYQCQSCEYVTKYCHSFKLHLRKYNHSPGVVLDEEGLPNPSVVIDVYGTRRGPKSKSGAKKNPHIAAKSHNLHRNNVNARQRRNNAKVNAQKVVTAQLSPSFEKFTQQQQPKPTPPTSTSSEIMALRQMIPPKPLQQPIEPPAQSPQAEPTALESGHDVNALSNLATLLQQKSNMSFLPVIPYLQLLVQQAAAQQAAAEQERRQAEQRKADAFAKLPSNMRSAALYHLQLHHAPQRIIATMQQVQPVVDEDEDKSNDSAMDLSRSTPSREEPPAPVTHQTPVPVSFARLQEESNETPVNGINGAARRKGRALQWDALFPQKAGSPSPMPSPEQLRELTALMAAANGGVPLNNLASPRRNGTEMAAIKTEPQANEMETEHDEENDEINAEGTTTQNNETPAANSTSVSHSTDAEAAKLMRSLYECKYCGIFFKDEILYVIHLSYHSCDDIYKCSFCGEVCANAVSLFMHVSREAHK